MSLFYRKYGSGQPVIILHGLLGLCDNWVTIARKLSEKFTVFIPDQRNHGRSPRSEAMNYHVLTEDIVGFIHEHGIEKPILIGHSMGGKVAMNYTLLHPAGVDKLVVIDISMREYQLRQSHAGILEAMAAVNFDEVPDRNAVEAIPEIRSLPTGIRQLLMKNLFRISPGRFGWRLNLEALGNNLEEVYRSIRSPEIYEGPALFIRGGRSDYIIDLDYDILRRNFPAAVFRTVPGAGHWVHADAPVELCSLLSAFLGRECEYTAFV